MLDGGGSSQGSFNGTKVTSTRVVSNFITIWEKDDSGKTEDTSSEDSKEEEVSPLVITPDPDPSAIVGWDCGHRRRGIGSLQIYSPGSLTGTPGRGGYGGRHSFPSFAERGIQLGESRRTGCLFRERKTSYRDCAFPSWGK